MIDEDHFRLDIGARQVRGAAGNHVPEMEAVVGFPEQVLRFAMRVDRLGQTE